MLGLLVDGKPLLRAYSIVSAPWDDELHFFSIKVPNGPLTSRLRLLKKGDKVLLGKKATGTLVLGSLTSGKTLYLFATGTGIAPFLSLIRNPVTYDNFENILLTQTCRSAAELEFGKIIVSKLETDPLVGEIANRHLIYDTSVTQDSHYTTGRITTRIASGALFDKNGLLPMNKKSDRAMICGSTNMLGEMSYLMKNFGLREGSLGRPAEFVIEKAFVS